MCEPQAPEYVRHLNLYDAMSSVLDKADAAANAVFGLDHGLQDFPVDRRCVDEMCTLVTIVQDYLEQAKALLIAWYEASPSGDGSRQIPQRRGMPDEQSELPSAAAAGWGVSIADIPPSDGPTRA